MSFTAAYTELYAIRDGTVLTDGVRKHPRVLDPDGLDTVHEKTDISESTFHRIAVTGEQEILEDYPKQTWDCLKGFKSWKPTDAFGIDHDPDMAEIVGQIERHEDYRTGPLGYGYNIERMGIPYGGWDGAWKTFFAEVSRHTEPFAFYHSPVEHEFPDVTRFADGTEAVYYVEVRDGQVYAEEQKFARVGVETHIDEIDKTAEHTTSTEAGK